MNFFKPIVKRGRVVASQLARIVWPTTTIMLGEHHYRVGYDAHRAKEDRDYPLLRALARGRTCIFDVGGNKGLTSLMMATAAGKTANIYTFDASEAACVTIQENSHLNQMDQQIQVINAVLWHRSGHTIPFYHHHNSGGASTIAGYLGHHHALAKVTLSLDDFVQQQGVVPDFVKIDVEGAEEHVLQGATKLMTQHRPLMLVEAHSWEEMTMVNNAAALLQIAQQHRYHIIYLDSKTILEDVSILAHRGRCHLLFLPQEQPLPDWLASFDTTGL